MAEGVDDKDRDVRRVAVASRGRPARQVADDASTCDGRGRNSDRRGGSDAWRRRYRYATGQGDVTSSVNSDLRNVSRVAVESCGNSTVRMADDARASQRARRDDYRWQYR